MRYWCHPESGCYFADDEPDETTIIHCDEISYSEYVKHRNKTIPIIADFETYWGPNYTLSKMTTESYIRDERFHAHGAGMKIGGNKSVWIPSHMLKSVFQRTPWPDVALIGHHLNFDGGILAWRYGVKPRRYIDTLALSRTFVGPHSPRHSLEVASKLLCGLEKYPGFLKESYDVRELWPELEAKLAHYCAGPISPCGQYAGDVTLTDQIARKLLPFVPALELDAMDWAIRIFTSPKVFFDREMLVRYHAEVKARRAAAMESIDDLVIDYMVDHKVKVPKGKDPKLTVVRSNDHYAALLRSLGVEPPLKWVSKPSKKHPDGHEAYAFAKTDEQHVALLDHDNEIVSTLVGVRMEMKSSIEETRSKSYLEVAERGSWPIHLNYAGAHTIRFSGGNGAGGNPQNLKRGGTLRDAICAPPGRIFLVSDLSQIEARIALWIGMHMPEANGEAEALEVMRAGGDIYAYFGSIIYDMVITKKTHPYERQVAKSAVLGLGFGMGWERFIAYCKQNGILNMTEDEAKRIVKVYRSMFKGIAQSWKYIQNTFLPAMMAGRTVHFPSTEHSLVISENDPVFGGPGILLPGGLHLMYPDLKRNERGEWSYYKAGAGKPTKIFGGFTLENIVQAVAGRILREHIIIIERGGLNVDVPTNTHDELPTLIDDREELQLYREEVDFKLAEIARGVEGIKLPPPPVTPESQFVERVMTTEPAYLPGIPLAVEYDYGYRYGDAK